MSEFAKEITLVNLEDEMKQSYLDYAMSVIVGRALPDVRDGLKPVHRRVLYVMHEQNNDWNKPYKKSARVVGTVMGKYHPHGDTAIYDTIVRMAQPFSLRYMLVDGQGNFGSVDGDAPAAMRYTEVRMAKIAHTLLADIDKETVNFKPNYDESESEPEVLPARLPNLLINGSTGIAVGMATNIPPHNITEVIDCCLALIDKPDMSIDELLHYIPGPDFPTAAIINGSQGIVEAYKTGRGRIYVRARTEIETEKEGGKEKIIVTELPYQVNKARLLEKIAELVKEKKLEGITELRDESDKDGMRMVIELRRGEVPEVVINNLYQHTQMQNVFGINMVALIDGQPRLLNLKEIIAAFLRHRQEVVTRRTLFDLRKARERAHILEGQAVALTNIDEIIVLIKAAVTPAEARTALLARRWLPGIVEEMLRRTDIKASSPDGLGAHFGLNEEGYRFTEVQARAILDMQLQRLTGLEQDKIVQEYRTILDTITALLQILMNPDQLIMVIRNELVEIKDQYQDARRTEIVKTQLDLNYADLITEEDVVVTLSHLGYVKTQPLTGYAAQRRGGRGKSATNVKDEDFIDKLFIINTHDTILCFSSAGKVYQLKVYELPLASRVSRGRPIVNLLPLAEGERINTMLPVKEFVDDKFVFMATSSGVVKKTPLRDFERRWTNGIIATNLRENDHLIGVAITDGSYDIMLFTSAGKAVRFKETDVRPMGRTACGVRGIRLMEGQSVLSLIIVDNGAVLTVTENGFGKRTDISDYPTHGRGGQGVRSIQTTERNGDVVAAVLVNEDDEIMLITNVGTLIRTRAAEISVIGRNTQGVKLITPGKNERLVGLEKVAGLALESAIEGDVVEGDVVEGDVVEGDVVIEDAGIVDGEDIDNTDMEEGVDDSDGEEPIVH